MMRRFPRPLSVLLCLALLALALAGCGPAAAPAPTQPPAEVPATAVVEQVAPTPTPPPVPGEISENVGVHAYPGDMPSLDPPYMLTGDTNIGFNAYETLTRWTPEEGVIPILATSWESNEDATEWTFRLREGVTFHDGTPLTAADIKASLDRNIEIGMVAYDFIGIESIEVVDDQTVRFVASAPRDLPLILSAQYGMFVYSAAAAQQPPEWFAAGNDAGTGPYMVESYEPGTRVVLTQYKDYWGGWEEGQFTKIVYEIVEDPTVREQMMRSGEADITAEIPFDSVESLESAGGIVVLPFLPLAHLVAGFNLDSPPLDNLQVRQALAHSFPYEAVQQGVFRGYGPVGKGFGPQSLWEAPPDFPPAEFNLDKAKSLLEEAGYGDGFELNLALSAGVKETLDTANLWQAELAKLGVTLNVQQLSSGAFWDYAYDAESTEYQIFMVPASGDVPSPYAWLICYTSSPLGWMPYVGYNNPEFDTLVFDAWAQEATDPDQANGLWVQAQRILVDDAASVFALDYPIVFAYGDDIVGFEPNPAYSDIVFWYELRRQ